MQLPDEDPTSVPLQQMLERAWKTNVLSMTLLGAGVYGRCYTVTLGCSPYRVLVKIHHYPGLAEQEKRQLVVLRTHLPERGTFTMMGSQLAD